MLRTRVFFSLILTVFILGWSCSAPSPTSNRAINPAAEGFDLEGSDEKAIAIADEVMDAMGGRSAWDKTERLYWNFFGGRTLSWDKKHNRVKVHLLKDSTVIDLDMNDASGSVMIKGETLVGLDTVATYLKRAKEIWINDSYWLVMPFKLKDSGVTLTYEGRDTTAIGQSGDKLSLTFEGVGITPQNKYDVIVTDETRLVEEWRFYTNATDTIPRFITPWGDYKKYGDIMLSGDRGRNSLTEIAVGTPSE